MVVCCLQVPPPPPSPTTANPNAIESLRSDLVHKFNTPFELKQIHSHLIKTNNSSSCSSILPLNRVAAVCALTTTTSSSSSSSSNNHNIDYAHSIFQRVPGSHETVLWNSCLKTLAEGDSPWDAILLFSQLRHSNILPDTFTCSFVLKASSLVPHLPTGLVLHALVHKLGFQSDLFLQNTILHMYTRCCPRGGGGASLARRFFDKMPQRDVVSWNIIITHLTKHDDIHSAQALFDQMPKRSVRSWTSMIGGYVQCGRPKDAIRVFQQMEQSGTKPNEVTLVAVLSACADLGALDLGTRLHQDYLTTTKFGVGVGFLRNVRVCNTLIDMYIKCGCLDIARKVFHDMQERTVVSWSAMIGGLAMHGQAEEALELFSKMSRIGIRPNGITFIGLLHACSHMGLIDEGYRFFTSMTRDYGITPQIEHYGCMVDLLSRAGRLEQAHEFIKNMPIKANGVVWGALLGGCKVHKNIELAEEAIKHLLVLDPLNDGYYVVLSNIYADARRWEDAARIRKLMRDQGVKKTPGWSSISVDGMVHEFVAGDADHPQAEEIDKKWQELLTKMKLRGYVPDTGVVLLDMDDEEQKVNVLYRHSEKLAVVYGLMNSPPGRPIRIMKNLRVCEDCHSALKLISEIDRREIVVRDRNRFHCFKDGSCSCKDYW